jgi:hypothetical protein
MILRVQSSWEVTVTAWPTESSYTKDGRLTYHGFHMVLCHRSPCHQSLVFTWNEPLNPGRPKMTAHGQAPGLARVPPTILKQEKKQ